MANIEVRAVENLAGTGVPYAYAVKAGPWLFLTGHEAFDFATGHALTLTGSTEIVWDGPELAAFAGAQRLVRFTVAEGIWIENAAPLGWSAPEPARQLAATGSWENGAG